MDSNNCSICLDTGLVTTEDTPRPWRWPGLEETDEASKSLAAIVLGNVPSVTARGCVVRCKAYQDLLYEDDGSAWWEDWGFKTKPSTWGSEFQIRA